MKTNLRPLSEEEFATVKEIIGFYDYDVKAMNKEFAASVIPEPVIEDLNAITDNDDITTYLASICWIYLLRTKQNI